MGVSFKVAKVGTRYRPKPVQDDAKEDENGGSVAESQPQSSHNEGNLDGKGSKTANHANLSVKSGQHVVSKDMEVSFLLNLFPDGFSIGKASELINDVPNQLCPYDRSSKALFSAIECGWLPGAISGDISCKYNNGAVLCEIRDYRNSLYEKAGIASAVNSPVVHKLHLQMSMENVIKDILSISNDSWTYTDLLEVESYILKALQPDLHLSPEPLLNRYSGAPMTKKLELGITREWKKRKLNDAPATDPSFSGQHQRHVPCSQLTSSSSILSVQNNNGLLESILPPNILKVVPTHQSVDSCSQSVPIGLTSSRLSAIPSQCFSNFNSESREPSKRVDFSENKAPGSQPNPWTMLSNHQVMDACSLSVLTNLTSSNLSSVPTQHLSYLNSVLREPSSLVLPQQGRCEMQAVQRPIIRMPKNDTVDFSEQQLPRRQPNPLTMVPNYQLVDSCSKSGLVDLTSSSDSSMQCFSKCTSELREFSSSVVSQGRCEMQAFQRPIIQKPKNDTEDFSQQKPHRSQSNPLRMVPNYELVDSCHEIGIADLTSSNLSSFPTQCFSICELRQRSSWDLSWEGRSERRAIQQPIMKIPKPEPVDFSLKQPSGSQTIFGAMVPNYQLVDRCNQSVLVDLTTSSLSSVPPTKCFSLRKSESKDPSSLVLSLQGTCERQAVQRSIIHMPQQESLDFSRQPALGSSEIIFGAGQLQENSMLPGPKKNPCERFLDKGSLSLSISGQQAILDSIPRLHEGMSASSVKQEPAEIGNFSSFDVQKDKYLDIYMSNNLSNHQRSPLQGSSQMLGMISPQMNSPSNQMLREKNMRKEAVSHKRKALQSPQVGAGVNTALLSSYQNESLRRESSVPVKRKKNYHSKGTSTEASGSIAVSGNTNATVARSVQLGNLNSLQTSDVQCSLGRFLKIKEVTERCGLDGKRKFDKILPVSFELWNSEESGKSKNVSNLFADWSFDVSMMRTLKFAHLSHSPQDDRIPMVDGKACVKLVMSENRNEGFVEARFLGGHEEGIGSTGFALLPSFSTSGHFADLFTAQFTSLMACEGYCLVDEVVEPTLFNPDDCSSTQKATFSGGFPPAARALELSFSTWTRELSSPMGDSIGSINCRQAPSKNLLSGSHLLPHGNIQSAQQFSGHHLLRIQLEKTGRLSPERLQRHQILSNNNAHFQFQTMQRQRQQDQLKQSMKMIGGLGAAVAGSGSRHLGGATRGRRSSGHGFSSNSMGMRGSIQSPVGGQIPSTGNRGQFGSIGSNIPSSGGGQIPLISNVGQFSNIGINIPSSSGHKQFFHGISDNAAAVLANLDGQSRALTGGAVPVQTPNVRHGISLDQPGGNFAPESTTGGNFIDASKKSNASKLHNEMNAPT